jgi:hypothetical protein
MTDKRGLLGLALVAEVVSMCRDTGASKSGAATYSEDRRNLSESLSEVAVLIGFRHFTSPSDLGPAE